MKKFAWPMERLLAVTGQREQAARGELMRLSGALAAARQALAARERTMREALSALGSLPASSRLAAQRLFLGQSEGEIRRQAAMRQEVCRLEGQREEGMRRLTEIRRERRKLEQLRQRAWREHLAETARWEQKQMDEAGQIGFVRRAQAAAAVRED